MGVRVKPIKEKFDVCIDIEDSENGKRYYIYKEVNGMKLWVTKYKKLDRWHGAKAYVMSWENATKIVSQIFAGEIN